MRVKTKVVYGILGLLAFLPLVSLVIVQSIFALEAAYDSKLVIDAEDITVSGIVIYDAYNNDITNLADTVDDKPALWSVIEATEEYILFDFHGGLVNEVEYDISGLQFILDDGTKTELLRGIVYLKFKNVDMAQDTWLTDFIEDTNDIYVAYFKQPQGTLSFVWVKIIAASLGTILGIAIVALVVLHKSTKALVKRYWRISVLVALLNGTIVLGLITWLIADIFQVFAAVLVGWTIFLGAEKLARIKGYLDSEPPDTSGLLPEEAIADVRSSIDNILAKYRK